MRIEEHDLNLVRESVRSSRKAWRGLLVAAILVTSVLAASRFTKHLAATDSGPELPKAPRLPVVSTVMPQRSQEKTELALPAEIDAYQQTSVYARIRGYLKSWKADRGDRVSAGQVLAVIDAPEFDQELRRSQADLMQGRAEADQTRTELQQAKANVEAGEAQIVRAQANLDLAAKTVERFRHMIETWAASQQQLDESIRNHDAAKAELAAAKADVGSRKAAVESRKAAISTAEARVNSLAASVQRLKELESFKTVTAPFEGTITRRYVDVGAFISDDGSKPLFTIIQDDLLRVRVNVPQSHSVSILASQEATLTLRELPGRKFATKVSRTARAIDPVARTLTVELELPNKENATLPGSFAQVRFALSAENAPLTIPASTLKMSKQGTQVVVVGNDHVVRIQKVELGRDMGSRVEIIVGLIGNEKLVVNPADELVNGTRVETVGASAVAAR